MGSSNRSSSPTSVSRPLHADCLHCGSPGQLGPSLTKEAESSNDQVAKLEGGLRYERTASLLLLDGCGAAAKMVGNNGLVFKLPPRRDAVLNKSLSHVLASYRLPFPS
jgi:hypothetical protein